MTTISNIQKLEEYFGVRRVLPRLRVKGNYVYVPRASSSSKNISFGCDTTQTYLLNKKRMSVLPDTEKNMIIFYPNNEGEFKLSGNDFHTKTITATAIHKRVPNIQSGKYVPEPLYVGDLKCFCIRYKESR